MRIALVCAVLMLAAVPTFAATNSLIASPAVLDNSGDSVTVAFEVPTAGASDAIAVYAGANASSPMIGFYRVELIPGWSTGSGKVVVPLVNMRRPYSFGYLVGDNTVPLVMSTPVTFRSFNEPTQIRLSTSATDGSVTVMWVSNEAGGSVSWGLSPTGLSNSAASTASTYKITDMCTAPANSPDSFMDPGIFHTAVMSNLPASTRVYYMVTSNGESSSVMSFVSPPEVKASTETHMFLYGDLGTVMPWHTEQEQQPPSAQTTAWVLRDINSLGNTPASVLHIGDISYARGWAYLWEQFGAVTQPVATKVPYMVGIGNHEYDFTGQPFNPSWANYGDDSGGECGIPYETRFAMPGASPHRNLWYSYNYGNIHVVVMSTEHNFTTGSPQWNFIKQDLESVDRSVTPFVFLAGHRPMYSSSSGYDIGVGLNKNTIQTHMLSDLEPLMVDNKVTLGIWGHVHKYERSCGVQNFTCAESDSDKPVHLVVGSGGNVYQVTWASNLPESPPNPHSREHVQPKWSIFRAGEFGYGRVTTNATHLHFEFVGDQRGNVHDDVWLEACGGSC